MVLDTSGTAIDTIRKNGDLDKLLEKPAMLFKECLLEFLDTGPSYRTNIKSRAATTEFRIWETHFSSMTGNQPLRN